MNHLDLQSESAQLILKERAKILARSETKKSNNDSSIVFVFHVGDVEKYGLKFSSIEKVIEKESITKLPGNQSVFSGLLYYNSEVWPVINAQKLFSLNQNSTALEENLVLIRNPLGRFALEINKVAEQVLLDESISLTILANNQHELIQGIYQTDIAMIDIDAIFNYTNTLTF